MVIVPNAGGVSKMIKSKWLIMSDKASFNLYSFPVWFKIVSIVDNKGEPAIKLLYIASFIEILSENTS